MIGRRVSPPARPVGITLLALLALLAGIAHVVGALQAFGAIPAIGGAGVGFFVSDPGDGIIQIVAAVISAAVAGGLWVMQSWARKAVVVIAALNIVVALFTQIDGGETWLNALPAVLINAAILLYARSPRIRAALDA
ncbi:MAG: hypothetical protein IT338_02910 [Thermomicrobiales bacterium]|nr:hypothetical protein [Thermomicrobiales bacterium]